MTPEDFNQIMGILDEVNAGIVYIGVDNDIHTYNHGDVLTVKPIDQNLNYLLGVETCH